MSAGKTLAFSILLAVLVPRPAQAKLLDLNLAIGGGGGFGQGLAGTFKDDAFFDDKAGGLYGLRLGAAVLFIDVIIDHWQFTAGSVIGTWTQFMLGFDVDFALGDDPPPGQKKARPYAEIGAYAGYGVGTGGQVDPPLDNSEVSDKGLVGQASIGVDYRLTDVFSLGLNLPVTYAYSLKQGAADDEENYYQQFGAAAIFYARV